MSKNEQNSVAEETHVYTITILDESEGRATNFTVRTNNGQRVVDAFNKVWDEFFNL